MLRNCAFVVMFGGEKDESTFDQFSEEVVLGQTLSEWRDGHIVVLNEMVEEGLINGFTFVAALARY